LTNQWSAAHLDHTASPYGVLLDSRNPLRRESAAGYRERATELTFTSNRKQDQTTLSGNVCFDEVPDQFYVRVIAALTDADDQTFTNRAGKRISYRELMTVRTRKVTERQVCQVRTTDFKADTILGKAQFPSIRILVWSFQEGLVSRAWVQDCALGTPNAFFDVFLVRDDSPEGKVFRDAQRLPILVNGATQDHLARPRAIGVCQAALCRAPFSI